MSYYKLADYQKRHGTGARIEDLSDVVEARITQHAIISFANQECYEIDDRHQPNAAPVEGGICYILEIQHENGDHERQHDNDHIGSQDPISRQGVVFVLAVNEVAEACN